MSREGIKHSNLKMPDSPPLKYNTFVFMCLWFAAGETSWQPFPYDTSTAMNVFMYDYMTFMFVAGTIVSIVNGVFLPPL